MMSTIFRGVAAGAAMLALALAAAPAHADEIDCASAASCPWPAGAGYDCRGGPPMLAPRYREYDRNSPNWAAWMRDCDGAGILRDREESTQRARQSDPSIQYHCPAPVGWIKNDLSDMTAVVDGMGAVWVMANCRVERRQ